MSHAKFQSQQVLLYLRRTIWSKRSSQEGRAQIHRNHPSSFIFKSDLNDLLFFSHLSQWFCDKIFVFINERSDFFFQDQIKDS